MKSDYGTLVTIVVSAILGTLLVAIVTVVIVILIISFKLKIRKYKTIM